MKTNDLKRGVYEALLPEQFEDNIDRLIVSCVLYTHLEKVISIEDKNQNNSRQLAQHEKLKIKEAWRKLQIKLIF